jgi:hypothetical protein
MLRCDRRKKSPSCAELEDFGGIFGVRRGENRYI